MWVLIAAGALLLLTAILLIATGVSKNKQVFRVYADLKGAKTEKEIDLLNEDDALQEEYSSFNSTGLIVLGVILALVVIGLSIAVLFLPGYPLSKYMSYAQCAQLAAQDPRNQWSWSIPPESGFWSFACRALGACICRSYNLETNCLLYRITNTKYAPNPWRVALAKTPLERDCLCCAG